MPPNEKALRLVARLMNEPIHWYKQGATTAVPPDVHDSNYVHDSITARQQIEENEYFGPKFSPITWEEAQQISAVSDDEDGRFNVICCLMFINLERISGGQGGLLHVVIKRAEKVIAMDPDNTKTPCSMLMPARDAPPADLTAGGHGVQLIVAPDVRVTYQVSYWKKDQLEGGLPVADDLD